MRRSAGGCIPRQAFPQVSKAYWRYIGKSSGNEWMALNTLPGAPVNPAVLPTAQRKPNHPAGRTEPLCRVVFGRKAGKQPVSRFRAPSRRAESGRDARAKEQKLYQHGAYRQRAIVLPLLHADLA